MMKKVFALLFFAFLGFNSISAQQAQGQQQTQQSRLVGLEKRYKIDKKGLSFLDSIKNVQISLPDLKTFVLKKVVVPDSLYILQEVYPIEAVVTQDSFGGYTEKISYTISTRYISEADSRGSYKDYKTREKKAKTELAAKLKAEAAKLEDDN